MPRSKNTTTPAPPTSTSTPTLTSRLHELVSACFTGIWVQTHEPHEVAREITSPPEADLHHGPNRGMIGKHPRFRYVGSTPPRSPSHGPCPHRPAD